MNLTPLFTWGRGLSWVRRVSAAGVLLDAGAYVYNAPEGQRAKAFVAAAADTAGGWAAAEMGGEVGAWIGAYGGPFDEITIPAGAAIGAIVFGLGWDATAKDVIRKWGSTPDPTQYPTPTTADDVKDAIRRAQIFRHYP